MIFKNKRGDVPWYVIALILAVLVLLVSIGAISKIKKSQDKVDDAQNSGCTVLGGLCQTATCTEGESLAIANAACPEKQFCCKAPSTQ